jgi:hypothetical protein
MNELLAFVAASGQADQPKSSLRAAGAVLAFEELAPTWAPVWRQDFPGLYRKIELAMALPKEFHGWADFLVVQWFILRRDDLMLQLLERAGAWGERDDYTAKLISQTAEKHGPFRHAAERLKLVTLVVN